MVDSEGLRYCNANRLMASQKSVLYKKRAAFYKAARATDRKILN